MYLKIFLKTKWQPVSACARNLWAFLHFSVVVFRKALEAQNRWSCGEEELGPRPQRPRPSKWRPTWEASWSKRSIRDWTNDLFHLILVCSLSPRENISVVWLSSIFDWTELFVEEKQFKWICLVQNLILFYLVDSDNKIRHCDFPKLS